MRFSRTNPLGLQAPEGTTVVQIGQGVHTHVYNPKTDRALCNSGKNAGRVRENGEDNRHEEQELYRSNAQMITCYRCQKLVMLNLRAQRQAWEAP